MTMYGRDDETWDRLTEAGLAYLIECAQRSGTTTYADFNTELEHRTGLPGFDFANQADRTALGHLLGLIVDRNHPETGLMISALVTYGDRTGPGPGFFALAADRVLLPRRASAEQKDLFWVTQMNRLHAYYSGTGISR